MLNSWYTFYLGVRGILCEISGVKIRPSTRNRIDYNHVPAIFEIRINFHILCSNCMIYIYTHFGIPGIKISMTRAQGPQLSEQNMHTCL